MISLARALSFNGLANAFHIAAINGGRHVAPLFAGGTVFAWSEVLAKSELPGRRRRRRAAAAHRRHRDRPCADFPYKTGEDYDPAVLLDLDYWVLIPRLSKVLQNLIAMERRAGQCNRSAGRDHRDSEGLSCFKAAAYLLVVGRRAVPPR